MKKIINLILGIFLLSSLFIKYAVLEYFAVVHNYYVYNVPWLRVLIIITSLWLIMSALFKIKYLNNYIVIFSSILTFFSWISFYQENKIIDFYDTSNNLIEVAIRKEIFIIPIILILILIWMIILLISDKKKRSL